jgi:hypothetical protein
MNQDGWTDFSTGLDTKGQELAKKYYGGVFTLKATLSTSPIMAHLSTLPGYEYSSKPMVPDAYDTVKVLANALDELTKASGVPGYIPPNADVVAQIRGSVLEGASGLVRFCDSDRLPLNWTIYNLPHGKLQSVPVLTAYLPDLFCPPPGTYSTYTILPYGDTETAMVFGNGLSTVPIDKPRARIQGLLLGTTAGSLALILLGMFLILLGFILIQVNANTRVIKGSSVLFCNLILIGVLIALIGLAVETLYDRSQPYACMLVPALLALSFDVTFGSLFAKTWRLVKIFRNAQHLKPL